MTEVRGMGLSMVAGEGTEEGNVNIVAFGFPKCGLFSPISRPFHNL